MSADGGPLSSAAGRWQVAGMRIRPALFLLAALLVAASALAAPAVRPLTPGGILAQAPAGDWQAIDPNDLLVLDFAGGRRAVIQLAPAFAPVHVANIRALARAHFYDGLVIERVQDDYVTQLGDPTGRKPLPKGVAAHPPAEYDRPAAGVAMDVLPYADTYAPEVGFADGWPTAKGDGRAWMTHCYGMAGVGRDLNPDTGSGSELYVVIGHSPRALDRNIALIGRVLEGMDDLAALPRGPGEQGFYADAKMRVPILHARIAADMPAAQRPRFQRLRTDSATFKAWSRLKANRQDDFFLHPAGAVDLCNALPPLRKGGR
jgi:peptidylprolyl isomerase